MPSPAWLWWLKQLIFTLFALFFLFFGISLLISSYQLKDPFSFIMTFFGASLITLISAVMILGFFVKMKMGPKTNITGKPDPTESTVELKKHGSSRSPDK